MKGHFKSSSLLKEPNNVTNYIFKMFMFFQKYKYVNLKTVKVIQITEKIIFLFLFIPKRIIPARTWRAVTPGRGAAMRACVRAATFSRQRRAQLPRASDGVSGLQATGQ